MNDRRTPRIYVEARLVPSAEIELQRAHAHYLGSVLRLAPGAEVAVFNGIDGEWLCRVTEIGRAGARLRAIRHTRPPEAEDALDPWLLFAPIKRARLDWLIEKATELGVAAFLPVWTRRTQVERINLDRLRAHAIEAAEQSERLTVPELRAPEPLDRMLSAWPRERRLVICDENGGEPIAGAAARLPSRKLALLVGPEGGFDQTELDAVGKLSFVTRVGLGPRVLRAETAALAAVAVFQAIAGDWRRVRTR